MYQTIIFIDGEIWENNQTTQTKNLQKAKSIKETLSNYWQPALKKCFANFTKENSKTHSLLNEGVELIHCPTSKAGKSHLSMYLAIAVREAIIKLTEIKTVIIVTNNGEFLPLILSLRKKGIRTFIASTSESYEAELKNYSDEFFILKAESQPTNVTPKIPRVESQQVGKIQKATQLQTPYAKKHIRKKVNLTTPKSPYKSSYAEIIGSLHSNDQYTPTYGSILVQKAIK